jgi:hypothetical protein
VDHNIFIKLDGAPDHTVSVYAKIGPKTVTLGIYETQLSAVKCVMGVLIRKHVMEKRGIKLNFDPEEGDS